MKCLLTFLTFAFLSVSSLPAQLNLKVGAGQALLDEASPTTFGIFHSSTLLPTHVQDNPLGYSYLCRLELDIEEKLPVGVWMKIGDSSTQMEFDGLPRQNAYVRFKLFRF